MVPDPALFIGAINLIAARHGSRCRAAYQHAPVAAAIFARMLSLRRHRPIWRRHADVAQVQRRVTLVQYVVVIGKADELTVGAIDMDVAAAAQRAGRVRGGNVHGVQILDGPLKGHHPAAMMKIILPLRIRLLGAMNKHIALLGWMHGHHANARALRGMIDGLHSTAVYVHSLNGFAGERRAGRADVEHQPLAVGGPGAGVSELVVARGKGNLFHGVLTGPI